MRNEGWMRLALAFALGWLLATLAPSEKIATELRAFVRRLTDEDRPSGS